MLQYKIAYSWLCSPLSRPFGLFWTELAFKHLCTVQDFSPECLSRDLHKASCTLAAGSTAKPHQARHKTPNKISTSTKLRKMFCTYSLPRYASTIFHRCIALVQFLYRWQHQIQNLWILPASSRYSLRLLRLQGVYTFLWLLRTLQTT
jgi:hypothetical protein